MRVTVAVLLGLVVAATAAWWCLRGSDAATPAAQASPTLAAKPHSPEPSTAPVRGAPAAPPAAPAKKQPDIAAEPPIKKTDPPEWLKGIVRACQLSDSEVAALVEEPDLLARVREEWNAQSKGYSEIVHRRSNATGRIGKERQAAGRYEVFQPGQRLPDNDPRTGEYITYGYEPNPAGGPDLVRVIRILPGEDAVFDRVRQEEEQLLDRRKSIVGRMIRGR